MLLLTIAVIIFALLFNFIIGPVITKSKNLSRQIMINRMKLGRYLWLINNKEEIRQKYAKYIPPVAAGSQQREPLLGALAELENLAKSAGIKIVDLRPQANIVKKDGPYQQTAIDMRTEGTLEAYINFIYNIENSLSLMKICSFQLAQRANSGLLEGTFSIIKLTSD